MATVGAEEDLPPSYYLNGTYYINFSDGVQEKAQHLTGHLSTLKDKAVALFKFVRDEIKFGFTVKYYQATASDTLQEGIGYAQNKSTLFVAFLRSIGIPSRIVFCDLTSAIFTGIGFQDHPYVDHTYVEVYLSNRWWKVDGYVLDAPLYKNAREMLEESGETIGYGVHLHGSNEWTGEEDCLSMFVNNGSVLDFSAHAWGTHLDTVTFYNEHKEANNNFDLFFPINYITYVFFWAAVNRRIEAIRNRAAFR
jgi:hypothetical protein